MATVKPMEIRLKPVLLLRIAGTPFVIVGAVGDDEDGVCDKSGDEVGVELESESGLFEITPPCTVGGAVLFLVFADPET